MCCRRSQYTPLGAWDHTLSRADAAVVPRDLADKGCKKSMCDPAYLEAFAAAKFALAPAGDSPWSMRFFEAIMAQAIPIVDDASHTGRTKEERALGYHYLLRSDVEALLDSGGTLEYCASWAEANLRIFLKHQAWKGAPTTPSDVNATKAGCQWRALDP